MGIPLVVVVTWTVLVPLHPRTPCSLWLSGQVWLGQVLVPVESAIPQLVGLVVGLAWSFASGIRVAGSGW